MCYCSLRRPNCSDTALADAASADGTCAAHVSGATQAVSLANWAMHTYHRRGSSNTLCGESHLHASVRKGREHEGTVQRPIRYETHRMLSAPRTAMYQ